MSDSRLRELERRWKETGSVEDEAAYLLKRQRAGQLTENQIGLAAYLGHPACKLIWGSAKSAETIKPLDEFVPVILDHGKWVVIRTMIAAVRLTLPVWGKLPNNPFLAVPEDALAAVEKWLICPQIGGKRCDTCSAVVTGFTADVEAPIAMVTQRSIDEDIAARAQNVVLNVRELLEHCLEAIDSQGLQWLLVRTGEALSDNARWNVAVANVVYQTIADELVPWLLGYRDPIQERVSRRQDQED